MKKKILARIAELEKEKKEGKWHNPYNAAETNGYDYARRNELKFLKSLLTSSVKPVE